MVKVRKTPYYAFVGKGILENAGLYIRNSAGEFIKNDWLKGDEGVIIRLGMLFHNFQKLYVVDAYEKHIRQNFRNLNITYRISNCYMLVKCKDLDLRHAKVIKVYEEETKKIKEKFDTLLLLV